MSSLPTRQDEVQEVRVLHQQRYERPGGPKRLSEKKEMHKQRKSGAEGREGLNTYWWYVLVAN